jgi:hypothetical protein
MGFLASPIIQQILAGIQAAIAAAPQIEGIVTSAIALWKSLFEAGLISVEQQNAMNDFVKGVAGLKATGLLPPAWQVQPDPAPPTTTTIK